jgi:hypothetical protein
VSCRLYAQITEHVRQTILPIYRAKGISNIESCPGVKPVYAQPAMAEGKYTHAYFTALVRVRASKIFTFSIE